MPSPHQAERGHVEPDQVAAFLDRHLSGTEQAVVEAHLADCETCRQEVVEVMRVRRARPPWQRWTVLVPLAAAAALALLIAGPSSDVQVSTVREGSAEGVPRFEAVSPLPSTPVDPDEVSFVWRSIHAEAHYRVTLTDSTGTKLWTMDTADTLARLPIDVRLAPRQRYFWYVDALLPGGGSATTGIREMRTVP